MHLSVSLPPAKKRKEKLTRQEVVTKFSTEQDQGVGEGRGETRLNHAAHHLSTTPVTPFQRLTPRRDR